MVKAVSRDMLAELLSRFSKDTNWSQLDSDQIQREVVQLSTDEFGRRATAWLKNGTRLEVKGSSVLTIDRTKPFDPVKFIGSGWSVVNEESDKRSLALTIVDFSKITFESGLCEGETTITGEEKLKRLKAGKMIHLDAKYGQALLEEKGQATLRFLHDTYGISWMEFAGTVLRSGDGGRCFLYFYRHDDGSWRWSCRWLDYARDTSNVSPLLATLFISNTSSFRKCLFFHLSIPTTKHLSNCHQLSRQNGILLSLKRLCFPEYHQ